MEIKNFYTGRYADSHIGENLSFSDWQDFTYQEIIRSEPSDKKILEIGVGPSGLIYTLKKTLPSNQYYGFDLDKNVLEYLKKNDFSGTKIDISNDAAPYEDNYFDMIILNEVIEHVFDCQHALDEIFRILKKGGQLHISTHNSFNIYMRLLYLIGKIPTPSLDVTGPTMGEHIHLFHKNTLMTLLKRAGFRSDTIRDKSWFRGFGLSFFTGLLTSILARHLYFICQK